MSEPFKLFQLQQIDSKLDKITRRKAEITEALASSLKVLQAQKLADKAKNEMDAKNADLKGAEQAVNEQKIKIDQNQAALYGGRVSNPKELQDLQAESVSLKSYLEVLEERQLEAMLIFEDAESGHASAAAKLATTQEEAAAENKELSAELNDIDGEFTRGTAEKETLTPQISQADMDIYQKLRERRAGIAVARSSGTNCEACGTTLARALAQAAKSPSKLAFCTTCGRILYGK